MRQTDIRVAKRIGIISLAIVTVFLFKNNLNEEVLSVVITCYLFLYKYILEPNMKYSLKNKINVNLYK